MQEIIATFELHSQAIGEVPVQCLALECLTTLAEEAASSLSAVARRQAVQAELLNDPSAVSSFNGIHCSLAV